LRRYKADQGKNRYPRNPSSQLYTFPPPQQDHPQLSTTINDLVDQFGDTGVEEGEFPQARDDDYVPATTIEALPPRDHPQRIKKPTRKVVHNDIHYDEIPIDDPEVYVNNAFVAMQNEPNTYTEAMQRPDSKK
jgi:hypothetical protein